VTRIEQARAEIELLRNTALEAQRHGAWSVPTVAPFAVEAHVQQWSPQRALAVLAAADGTLDRHTGDGHVDLHDCNGYTHGFDGSLCPDAAAVLDLYAPSDIRAKNLSPEVTMAGTESTRCRLCGETRPVDAECPACLNGGQP
jgi:hypothetical protein